MLTVGNVYIRGLEMPAKTRGVTVEVEDDFFVFINTVLSPECQQQAISHEIRHIKANHFYKDEPVVLDERQAGEILVASGTSCPSTDRCHRRNQL